jgi:hypothetical protein
MERPLASANLAERAAKRLRRFSLTTQGNLRATATDSRFGSIRESRPCDERLIRRNNLQTGFHQTAQLPSRHPPLGTILPPRERSTQVLGTTRAGESPLRDGHVNCTQTHLSAPTAAAYA